MSLCKHGLKKEWCSLCQSYEILEKSGKNKVSEFVECEEYYKEEKGKDYDNK